VAIKGNDGDIATLRRHCDIPFFSRCRRIIHYCLVSLMWMKIGSNDITAQVPGVSKKLFSLVGTPKITRGFATRDFFRCPTRENNFFRLSSYCTVIPHYFFL
jgi:hypothetical protein